MGYVLAHLLLWTVGLVRDNVAMAEGLLGLLTEQELHVASARLGRQGRRWPVALAPHVQRGPGAECVCYTDRLLLSWRRAGARRVNSGFITMINPEIINIFDY